MTEAIHTGYGWVQLAMGPGLLAMPLWLVLVLPFAKILATSLSIGSGRSGGIFGPGMATGDRLLALTEPEHEAAVRAFLAQRAPGEPPPAGRLVDPALPPS